MMGRIQAEESLHDAAVTMVGRHLKGRGVSTQLAAWKRAASSPGPAQRATPSNLRAAGIGFREVKRVG
jgi:hypothetical protein